MKNYEVKLMCSYGGNLEPNNTISYVDGHTNVFYVGRNIDFSAMLSKLRKICREHVSEFKYQFPGKEDNILITVREKDDLENMMREYDNMKRKYDNMKNKYDKMMRDYDHILRDYDSMMRMYDKLRDDSNTTPVMRLFITPLQLSLH